MALSDLSTDGLARYAAFTLGSIPSHPVPRFSPLPRVYAVVAPASLWDHMRATTEERSERRAEESAELDMQWLAMRLYHVGEHIPAQRERLPLHSLTH